MSDVAGTVYFLAKHSGVSKVVEPDDSDDAIVAPSVRLDDVITEEGQRIAIKIDVEGRELNVLRGTAKLLEHNDCLLQIECFEDSHAAVSAWLKEHGYTEISRISADSCFAKNNA